MSELKHTAFAYNKALDQFLFSFYPRIQSTSIYLKSLDYIYIIYFALVYISLFTHKRHFVRRERTRHTYTHKHVAKKIVLSQNGHCTCIINTVVLSLYLSTNESCFFYVCERTVHHKRIKQSGKFHCIYPVNHIAFFHAQVFCTWKRFFAWRLFVSLFAVLILICSWMKSCNYKSILEIILNLLNWQNFFFFSFRCWWIVIALLIDQFSWIISAVYSNYPDQLCFNIDILFHCT